MNRTLRIVVLLAAVVIGYHWLDTGSAAVASADGSLTYDGYQIRTLDTFDLSGRVLSRHSYHSGREAELSPLDLAMGWGPMANPEVLAGFEITQGNRWYFWRTDRMPIPRAEIEHHSANIHIVPASQEIERQLDRIAVDDVIRVQGDLIEVTGTDGWRWRSSLSRTDRGNGSCELLLLRGLRWLQGGPR